jgi:AraC family transcriptional regulator
MASRDSRSEYERRMHRVVEHIDQHLDRPLDLATLAEVAHFSSFHFHRLFSAWMGETLGDYLRRRRVEVAAMRLVAQPRVTVLQTALSVGFGSAEAFTRAFNARFGCAPTSWRKQQARPLFANSHPNSNLDQVDRKMSQEHTVSSSEHENSRKPQLEKIMMVKIVDRQPVTIAYLRHLGPYGEPLSRFWQDTYYPWAVTNSLLEKPRYGISHDDPSITSPAQCRYDACAEVLPEFVASGNAFKTTIPGGKYAVLGFKGTSDQVGDAWTALLREWLPSSGLQLDARPCFEYYPKDAKFDPQTGTFECEICIPVVPL